MTDASSNPRRDPAHHRRKADPRALNDVEQTETVHHESASKKRRPAGQPALSLTSMMDVCFQLLIFFVLTAAFAVGEGILPADLPAGQSAAASDDPNPPTQPLNIVLRSLGNDDVSIQLENFAAPPANFNELYAMLKSAQNNKQNPTGLYNPDDPIIIKPDGTVKWGHVVNAFNAAIRARYTNVNFAQHNE